MNPIWGISDIGLPCIQREHAERIAEAELHRQLRAVPRAQRDTKQTLQSPPHPFKGARRSLAATLRRLADSIDMPSQPIHRSASRP